MAIYEWSAPDALFHVWEELPCYTPPPLPMEEDAATEDSMEISETVPPVPTEPLLLAIIPIPLTDSPTLPSKAPPVVRAGVPREYNAPVLAAFLRCALQRKGVRFGTPTADGRLVFEILDFDVCYDAMARYCNKQHPTDSRSARIKGMSRWFDDMPFPAAFHAGHPLVRVHVTQRMMPLVERLLLPPLPCEYKQRKKRKRQSRKDVV
jgi:hypothetical protein